MLLQSGILSVTAAYYLDAFPHQLIISAVIETQALVVMGMRIRQAFLLILTAEEEIFRRYGNDTVLHQYFIEFKCANLERWKIYPAENGTFYPVKIIICALEVFPYIAFNLHGLAFIERLHDILRKLYKLAVRDHAFGKHRAE